MGKKPEKPDVKPLPSTKAETAEQRLEEIVNNKSITEYEVIFEDRSYFSFYPYEGESRIYPDGLEAVTFNGEYQEGRLHVERRRLFIRYNLEKEYEKQKLKENETK